MSPARSGLMEVLQLLVMLVLLGRAAVLEMKDGSVG